MAVGLGGLFSLIASMLSAHAATTYSEQEKLIRAPRAFTALGTGLFGDKVNLYTGNLEFIQTDVVIPGNSPLRVGVGRRLEAGRDAVTGGLFGQWDLDIPHLHGVYSQLRGWVGAGNTTTRCSSFGAPGSVTTNDGASWSGTEFWHGAFLYVPGMGDANDRVHGAC
ncbi:hypothetical protein [Massilia sp. ZL223]|uniref:hypothetical protein n=1 Tax=Massilia sp. ZL223 TaxID=2824904 RepID=UPI001B83233F|nr:hypothetical protein [Massilia sp. ZL223]MBQ5963320.1 hypothetical protein [Massilia sp. ZL223]